MRWLALITVAVVLALGPSGAAAAPSVQVLGPADGALLVGDAVTVTFQVGDFRIAPSTVAIGEFGKRPDLNVPGEGHLHLLLDLAPLVVWDRAEPYTFADVPPGEHRLTVELANHDHSSLAPPVVREIRFRTTPEMPRAGHGGTPAAQRGRQAAGRGLLGLLATAILAARLTTGRGRGGTAA